MQDNSSKLRLSQTWKTTAGTSVAKIIPQVSKTNPDLHYMSTPNLKRNVTPQINRKHNWKVETKISQYQDPFEKKHNLIIDNIKFMPKEVINSMNMSYYQNQFQFHNQIDIQQVEFMFVDSLENITNQIIDPLFKSLDQVDKIGLKQDQQIYSRFHIDMLPKLVELICGQVITAIKYLIPKNKQISNCLEQTWKYFIFVLDLCMQWQQDRNNKYIIEQVTKLQRKIENLNGQVREFEIRILKQQKEHQAEMQQEKQRYYQLQSTYEKCLAKAVELERTINEDVKTVAEGGPYHLNKSIKELESTLKYLNNQFTQNESEFVSKLKRVAVVANTKKELIVPSFRQFIGINQQIQMPGDSVLSTLFTEHPWMPYFYMRNMIPCYSETPYNPDYESKLEILHHVLSMEQTSQNLCIQYATEFKEFPQLFKNILTLILPYEEANQVGIQLHFINGTLFNISGFETIESYYINEVKMFYQSIVKILSNIQQQALSQEKQEFDIEDEQFFRKILKLNNKSPRQIMLFQINLQFIKSYLSQFQFYNQILIFMEQKSYVQIIQLLYLYIQELVKLTKSNFENRLEQFEIPENILDLGQKVCLDVFPEYNLNVTIVQRYLVARLLYLKENELLLNKDCFKRVQESNFRQNVITQQVYQNAIRQLRNILLFSPTIFIKNESLNRQKTIQ